MNYMAELLHRASAGRKLTTREAAFLQAIKGALIGFIAPLIPYFLPVVTGQAHIVWSGEALSTLLGAFIAFVLRLYFSQNDEELGNLLEAYYQAKTKQALETLIAPGGDVSVIQFAIPVIKGAAQASAAQQPTPVDQGSATPSIHDITTSPQPAIAPVPIDSINSAAMAMTTAADRFAAKAQNVIVNTETVTMPVAPTVPAPAINPLTQSPQ